MGLFREKSRRRQAEALRDRIVREAEARGLPERPASWGRGILEEVDPVIGAHVTDCVYVFTDSALHYEYLKETPRQLLSLRALASGVGPGEWKALADSSHATLRFSDFEDTNVAQAVDGRWDLMFIRKGAQSPRDVSMFGVVETYGGRATLEDIASVIASLPQIAEHARQEARAYAGKPPYASEEELLEAAEAGQVHPRANLQRVFDLVFASRLDDGEERRTLVPGAMTSGRLDIPEAVKDGAPEGSPGWLLVTDRAVRWHYTLDGIPSVRPPPGSVFVGLPRDAYLRDLELVAHERVPASLDRAAMQAVVVQHRPPTGGRYVHMWWVGDSPDRDDLVEHLKSVILPSSGLVVGPDG